MGLGRCLRRTVNPGRIGRMDREPVVRQVPQAKVAALARVRARLPVPLGQRRAMQRVSFDVVGYKLYGRMGDAIVMEFEAPSGAAARAMMVALRQLQETRGTIW